MQLWKGCIGIPGVNINGTRQLKAIDYPAERKKETLHVMRRISVVSVTATPRLWFRSRSLTLDIAGLHINQISVNIKPHLFRDYI
jgi:hypothetical protein